MIKKLSIGDRESSNEKNLLKTKTKTQFFAENKKLQEDDTNGTFLDSSNDDSRWSTDRKT